jgi:hypothetical protein
VRAIPYDPVQPYRNRSYVLHKLDQRVFDALNKTPVWRDADGVLREAGPAAVSFINGYCLDAIDSIPGGSMLGSKSGPIQAYVQRNDLDTSPEYRRHRAEVVKRLIDEILAEEKLL